MGNPPILNQDEPATTALLPARKRVIWAVYRLRNYQGEKLSVAQIVRTRQEGLLQLWRVPGAAHGELHARLWDPSSDHLVLETLYNVQVARSERGGGLLLRGTTLSVKSGVATEVRQSWWCLVNSVEADQGSDG